mgnify:CR=1 FL=1
MESLLAALELQIASGRLSKEELSRAIDQVAALHGAEMQSLRQELGLEVSLYRREAFRLQTQNDELRLQIAQLQAAVVSGSDQCHIISKASSFQEAPNSPQLTALSTVHKGVKHLLFSIDTSRSRSQKANDEPPKCVPLEPPIPLRFTGDRQAALESEVPAFAQIANYPLSQESPTSSRNSNLQCCTMCKEECPTDRKNSKKNGEAVIPKQNKGVCTACDVKIWVVSGNDLQIKWCKGCKNFCAWAAFGEKGFGTKCMTCRKRSAERYAEQKEKEAKKAKLDDNTSEDEEAT